MDDEILSKLKTILKDPNTTTEVIDTEFATITKVSINKDNPDDPIMDILKQLMLASIDCNGTIH